MNHFDVSGFLTIGEVTTVLSTLAGLVTGILIGHKYYGLKGAAIGGILGAAAGAAFPLALIFMATWKAAVPLLITGFGSILSGLGLLSLAPPMAPPPPQGGGFTTQSRGQTKGQVFICVANAPGPAGGFDRDQFGDNVLRQLAGVFYYQNWEVTYGRPTSRGDFYSQLGSRSYDIIYIVSHGGHTVADGSNAVGGSMMELIRGSHSGTGETFLWSPMELSRLSYRPSLVFLDGCRLDQLSNVPADCLINSTRDRQGTIVEGALVFFMSLFIDEEIDGDVEKAFDKFYRQPNNHRITGTTSIRDGE